MESNSGRQHAQPFSLFLSLIPAASAPAALLYSLVLFGYVDFSNVNATHLGICGINSPFFEKKRRNL